MTRSLLLLPLALSLPAAALADDDKPVYDVTVENVTDFEVCIDVHGDDHVFDWTVGDDIAVFPVPWFDECTFVFLPPPYIETVPMSQDGPGGSLYNPDGSLNLLLVCYLVESECEDGEITQTWTLVACP